MKICTTCANRVFDDIFGDYKCNVFKHAVYDVDKYLDCKHYKEREAVTVKVGDKVIFDPFKGTQSYGFKQVRRTVIGTVVEVHD